MAFSGSLSLEDDARPLRADLELTSSELVVITAAGPVGRWSLAESRIEPSGGRFLVTVGGERAWFTPDESIPFTRQVLERWGAPSLASAVQAARAAVDPVEAQPAPAASAVPDRGGNPIGLAAAALSNLSDRQRWLIGGIWALLVIAVLVAALSGGGSRGTPVPGTIPTTTAVSAVPAVFAGGLDRVPALWNDAAARLGLEFFLTGPGSDRRLQVALPDDLVLYATTDPGTGLVRTLMISAGPGQGEHGQLVLAMWGNLMAMVSPELGPEDRRALLERLGVDIDRPLAIGLDSETIEGPARYRLRSGVIGGRVWLSVAPAA